VLGIDHVNLDAKPERSHQKRRQQVRLARSGIAEDSDVGVRMTLLVEGVDEHRRTTRAAAAHDQAGGLLHVRTGPREERDQRARVEDAPALETIDTSRKGRDMAIDHSERARLYLAEDGATGGADLLGAFFEGQLCGGHQRDVDRDVERLLLAGGKAPLKILGVG